jgi:hypothetical protein
VFHAAAEIIPKGKAVAGEQAHFGSLFIQHNSIRYLEVPRPSISIYSEMHRLVPMIVR